ncbi:uncharacterized protein LOC126833694 [Adelges cooleyi]|uniref:uncharacterized protein LOC126833694 n=1 Tax=Adelges cooleyi TaxID=133065 RepID=UPI00217F69DF|nr:uncharacterized protein LOC126833694 [Adelges cooleyi]
MHFKSSVILCALYLLTSAWSIGLNSKQLWVITKLYKNHKVTEKNITQLMKEFFGIQEPKTPFDCDSNEANSVDLKKLLLALAYKDKKTHNRYYENQTLTPFEVEFFLSVFTEHANSSDQDGYLSLQQLPGVLKDLKLYDKEIEKVVAKLKVKQKKRNFSKDAYMKSKLLNFNSITAQFIITEADFLLIMLETKPEGYGLDRQQIEKFVDFFNNCRKTDSGSIEPMVIQKIFIDFGMADSKHYSKMLFKSNRSAANELMELMLVTAERSRTEHTKRGVLDTYIVKFFLDEFVSHDKDSDGFLSHEEFVSWVQLARREMFDEPKGGHPKNKDGSKTHFAKFLKMMIAYYE